MAKRRYIVAVSGGVDSAVLLDIFANVPYDLLVVAHFDHGIRPTSAADARFVEALAKKYNLPFETERENLGKNANEDLARQRRYAFLRNIAKKYQADIITAHHADDVVETIAINMERGTNWRGLAVLNDQTIVRPLLHKWKQELYEYALSRRLEWVEDATNATDAYLRNRLRRCIGVNLTFEDKKLLHEYWQAQVSLSKSLSIELEELIQQEFIYSRYFMTMISYTAAYELLREVVLRAGGPSLLRSQLEVGVLAIRTARPKTKHSIARGIVLCCEKVSWSIQADEKMIP